MNNNIQTWNNILSAEKQQAYFKQALAEVTNARNNGKLVYPPDKKIFEAFKLTPLQQLKVVILGQDPYHNEGQAHGLCFSVPKGIAIPPSLKNIYKELADDIGCPIPTHGLLESWATQGVLLLNTVLTVEAGKPQSHQNFGWQQFTDKVITLVSQQCQHVVFILWGANAQAKQKLISPEKHLILKAPHPSPLSCYRGFYGCKHFSLANQFLTKNNLSAINWCIS